MDEQRQFHGIWISDKVWRDTNLSIAERFYIALFQQFSEQKADELMLKNISISTLKALKAKLVLKKYISLTTYINSPEQAKDFVIQNSNSGKICEWCGKESYILHSHHYPIPKKLGGKEIVRICPNCHCTYHAIYKED